MEDITRIDVSKLKQIKESYDLFGDGSSIIGEFLMPNSNETGFYKESGWGRVGNINNDEDFRELLASDILEILGVPHPKISLAYDSTKNRTGCISHSVLRPNESFIEDTLSDVYVPNIEDYVNREITRATQYGNRQFVENRKNYILRVIYIDCILGNYDVKYDSMALIQNEGTGEVRNSEPIDFGASFANENTFLGDKSAEYLMSEIYTKYPKEILGIARTVKHELTGERLNYVLGKDIYRNGFAKETYNDIFRGLYQRIELSNSLLEKLEEQIKEPNNIWNRCTSVGVELKDKSVEFIKGLLKRKERNEHKGQTEQYNNR